MKILRAFLAFLLSVAFSVVLIGCLFIFAMNNFVSKENMDKIINEVGLENLIDPYETDIMEITYLEIPEVKELFNRIATEGTDYIFNDKKAPQITEADIDKIVNSDYYEKELGTKLTEEVKILYKAELTKYYSSANESFLEELDSIKSELFEDDAIKMIFSPTTKYVIVGALVVIALLIAACRLSFWRSLSWIGFASVIASGLGLILSYFVSQELITEGEDLLDTVLFDNLFSKWDKLNIIALVVGVIFIIAYFVIRSQKKNKNDNFYNPEAKFE